MLVYQDIRKCYDKCLRFRNSLVRSESTRFDKRLQLLRSQMMRFLLEDKILSQYVASDTICLIWEFLSLDQINFLYAQLECAKSSADVGVFSMFMIARPH